MFEMLETIQLHMHKQTMSLIQRCVCIERQKLLSDKDNAKSRNDCCVVAQNARYPYSCMYRRICTYRAKTHSDPEVVAD